MLVSRVASPGRQTGNPAEIYFGGVCDELELLGFEGAGVLVLGDLGEFGDVGDVELGLIVLLLFG